MKKYKDACGFVVVWGLIGAAFIYYSFFSGPSTPVETYEYMGRAGEYDVYCLNGDPDEMLCERKPALIFSFDQKH
jgi:hypothetical protein